MISSRFFILVICIQGCIFTITNADGLPTADTTLAATTVNEVPISRAKRATTGDLVAHSALNFAHNIAVLLNEDMHYGKTTIFSPISIMSSMVMLMLGSKGRSYEDLRHIFRLDVPPLSDALSNAFHLEFGAMLQEMQDNAITLQARNRDNWRNTNVAYSIRNKPKISAENAINMSNVIKIVNGLFIKSGYELNANYRDVINSIYKSDVIPLDFKLPQARDYINDWVYKNTFGKINGIIADGIPADTDAILTSALYFRGFWESPFIQSATIIDNFFPDGLQEPPIKIQMMGTAGAYPYYFSPEYDCKIIGLPYVNNFTSMYVIQPSYSSRHVLRRLLKNLSAEKIEDMISKMVYQNAIFALPKMHLSQNINMKHIFRALGLRDVLASGERFSATHLSNLNERTWPRGKRNVVFPTDGTPTTDRFPQSFPPIMAQQNAPIYTEQLLQQAAFTNTPQLLQNNPATTTEQLLQQWSFKRNGSNNLLSDLYVGDIVHKVDLVVDENGTEGAAATATYLKRSGGNVLFRADTPFLLLVRHDATKLPLFYGIINIPAPSFV
ncbi:serine protease inhibitor 28Dc [Bactrocera neohumeralis]|uniref:serine protease inhibitor 28Dc n=1 Tax=Bactrocera neohumeralis TaxID=98809 RepID=UPI00216680C2|nr:serine protease inhibitor 28Dc [Bactrocera neohumeralis]